MQKIRIAGCRLPVTLDVQSNLKEVKQAIDWASEHEVDIISTPECALSGYLWKPNGIKDPRILEIQNAYSEICKYSKEKKVDIVLGTGWVNSYRHWNNVQHFIVDGNSIHIHYKNLLFLEEQRYYSSVNNLKTIKYKGFTIAGLICNEVWSNPYLFNCQSVDILNTLANHNADLVFVSANVPTDVRPRHLWYDWHRSWISMASSTLKMGFVVSDSTVLTDFESPVSPAGICTYPQLWGVMGNDFHRDYFLHDFEKVK